MNLPYAGAGASEGSPDGQCQLSPQDGAGMTMPPHGFLRHPSHKQVMGREDMGHLE